MRSRDFFSALICFLLFAELQAQQQPISLATGIGYRIEAAITKDSAWPHTAVKPWLESRFNLSAVDGFSENPSKRSTWFGRKLFDESFIEVHHGNFDLAIDPLFDFRFGKDIEGSGQWLYRNTRGFVARANIGSKFSVYSDFRENQAVFPSYISNSVAETGTVPSMGRVKPFGDEGYDFAIANACLSYTPWHFLNIRFGTGNHFFGEGYRSLVLSYNSFNYPYLQLSGWFFKNKLQYTSLYGGLQALERLPVGEAPESVFKRKGLTLHVLSYKPFKNLELAVFEQIIWQRYSDSEGTVSLDARQAIPVAFVNTLSFGFSDDRNNAMAGANISFRTNDNTKLYFQIVVDDPDKRQLAWQAGIQKLNLFRLFHLRLEYNHVEPYTYAATNSLAAFTHYNRPLAHPLGSGFSEILGELVMHHKRFYARIEMLEAKRFLNTETAAGTIVNTGADPLLPLPGKKLVSAEAYPLRFQSMEVAYIFNYNTDMQVYAGFTNRSSETPFETNTTQYYYIGLRTSLHPQYLDF